MGAYGAAIAGVTQGGLSINQANQQAKSLRAQAAYQASMAEVNAQFSEMQANDVMRRGKQEATAVRKEGQKIIGAQRAALAAQGIEVDTGSAAELQEETAMLSAEQAVKVQNNAWREAWGYKTQAAQMRSAARFGQIEAAMKVQSTLMTGGIQAANQVYAGTQNARGVK